MPDILSIIQIVLAVALMAGILLQQTESSMGGAFGGGDAAGGSSYHTRRGPEKFLFNATIVISIAFALVTLLTLVIGA